MSHNEEKAPQVPDVNVAILQALQGMMEMMREDREERRAHQRREERVLQDDEGMLDLVGQERLGGGRGHARGGRNNHANIMQPRRIERMHEDREAGVKLKIPPFSGTADLRHTCNGKEK